MFWLKSSVVGGETLGIRLEREEWGEELGRSEKRARERGAGSNGMEGQDGQKEECIKRAISCLPKRKRRFQVAAGVSPAHKRHSGGLELWHFLRVHIRVRKHVFVKGLIFRLGSGQTFRPTGNPAFCFGVELTISFITQHSSKIQF